MGLDLDRIFDDLDLGHGRRLVVAISGGSDSLSLLVLLRRFLERRGYATPVLAVTVDHRLRAQSADEALAVGEFCAARGIEHRTVAWDGTKPETGVIAAAREARHDLLADAAEAFGADCILTGHTLDDQAETVAMRAQRGPGAGLAGMARSTLFDWRVWIARPLLGVRRQALRDILAADGLEWIDDPSNRNLAYERVRMRAALAASGETERLAATAAREGRMRRDLAEQAGRLIDDMADMPSPGLFRLDAELLRRPDAHAVHALRVVLALAGGAARLPDAGRTRALFDTLSQNSVRVSLSRVVLDRRKDAVWLRREARSLPGHIGADSSGTWDGRWRVRLPEARGLRVARFGSDAAAEQECDYGAAPKSLVRAALSTEPALFDANGPLGPLACGQAAAAARIAGPFARYLPDFDLPLARAATRLLNIAPPPSSPWKHHNEPEA